MNYELWLKTHRTHSTKLTMIDVELFFAILKKKRGELKCPVIQNGVA